LISLKSPSIRIVLSFARTNVKGQVTDIPLLPQILLVHTQKLGKIPVGLPSLNKPNVL